MKVVATKVIDTLTQEDFHGAFEKLLEQYNKCIVAGGDYFEGDSLCIYIYTHTHTFFLPEDAEWLKYKVCWQILLQKISVIFKGFSFIY